MKALNQIGFAIAIVLVAEIQCPSPRAPLMQSCFRSQRGRLPRIRTTIHTTIHTTCIDDQKRLTTSVMSERRCVLRHYLLAFDAAEYHHC